MSDLQDFSIISGNGYYQRDEISNSDLGWLEEQLSPPQWKCDKSAAYKFGSLLDAICTEPHRVNYFRYTVDDVQYTKDEFDLAGKMMKSFLKDPLASAMLKMADTQCAMTKKMGFEWDGIEFTLNVRCKWDLYVKSMGFGGDLKSTTATTQKQFEAACNYFHYDRQRAFYMDIIGNDRDILIGVSKKNCEVFKLPITRGDAFYNSGKQKYSELAFKWWMFFNTLK